ncbi:MAG: ApbE family lipoprotein [Gammaproteobacteria bacterium]|nr:ApbE family lipoprotein [Gammaproteobacteria bacterium]
MRSATDRQDVTTHFKAMASPCLVLVDTTDAAVGATVGEVVKTEAMRVEEKYSRYRPSIVTSINENAGDVIEVDPETADLLDYAVSCYELSEGRFDITSGALRRAWSFDGSGKPPDPQRVTELLAVVGWHRVQWNRPRLRLAAGMEIDFGGIGKEYAVDRALLLAQKCTDAPLLINFGGDLRVSGPRHDGSGWRVAIEDVEHVGNSAGLLEFSNGALATSGDTYRHVMGEGVRYGHVLDPRTGWPIAEAPRSVTVHAATCTEAGLLAKLALLRGAGAEEFLQAEQVRAWCFR